jgi:hypothetical protein
MDEEPAPKPKLKLPLFLIVILAIFVLLAIIIVLSLAFGDSTFFNLFHSNVIISNIFSNENPSSARCRVYAAQFGVTKNSNCYGTDKEKCLALCTAHFECCEK